MSAEAPRHICRLCGSMKDEVDFDCVLSQIEVESKSIGGINFQDYVNFYCRITLSPSPLLPRKVCKLCRLQVETFIAFCDNLSKVERSIAANSPGVSGLSPVNIKTEPVKSEEEPLFETSGSAFGKTGRTRTSMQHIRQLYSSTLSIEDSFSLMDYAHITVDRLNVSDDGQIDVAWLSQYEVQTWNDFTYKCHFCSKTHSSLKKLLIHFNGNCRMAAGKIKFGCHTCASDSRPPFSSLNAYINHATRQHELEHLAYCCIECCKTYYNVAYLVKHISKEHPRYPMIYPCIECGAYCQGLTALKTHIMSHKSQEVSDCSDDEDSGPTASSTPIVKQEAMESMKKTSLPTPETKRAKVYPCNVCDRTLLTKRGFDYHVLVHANLKPYKCHHCSAAYRSKQDLDKHVLKHEA